MENKDPRNAPIVALLANIMDNKGDILKELITISMNTQETIDKLTGTLERFDTRNSEEDRAKQLKLSLKLLKQVLSRQAQFSTLLMLYASGDLDKDCATTLNKLGYGEEALKLMFKNKFK